MSEDGVSTHAPLRGATYIGGIIKHARAFQHTHPCGVRPTAYAKKEFPPVFQHTHPCGVRPPKVIPIFAIRRFQHTHPCGVRLTSVSAPARHKRGFNTRTPAGCDLCRYCADDTIVGFNTRTPAGCDEWEHDLTHVWISVSTHAPLRGATCV